MRKGIGKGWRGREYADKSGMIRIFQNNFGKIVNSVNMFQNNRKDNYLGHRPRPKRNSKETGKGKNRGAYKSPQSKIVEIGV
jgi:hypothetical protein